MKKILKNTLIWASASTIVLGAGTTVGLATYFNCQNFIKTSTFSFDNKQFNNQNDLLNYATNQYLKSSKTINNRYRWSLDDKNGKVYFNDPFELRRYLDQFITTYDGYSSFDLLNEYNLKNNQFYSQSDTNSISNYFGSNNELTDIALNKIYFGQPQITTIYRGKNNSIFQSEKEAKESYLSIHDAYYFNNIYFPNKEQLQLYLQNVYYNDPNSDGFKSAKQVFSISSIDNNGNNLGFSVPISKNDLYQSYSSSNLTSLEKDKIYNAKQQFVTAITSQAKEYLEYKDKNNKYHYFNDLSTIPSAELNAIFDNPDYVKIYSNQGRGGYVVDLSIDDSNTLYGPYYTSSSFDLSLMEKKENWKQISRDNEILIQQKDADALSSFINIIFYSANDENNTNVVDDPINKIFSPFFKKLRSSYPQIYTKFKKMLNVLKSGKRFNNFYFLIIAYKFLINEMVYNNCKQDIIKLTQNTFNNAALFLDKFVHFFIPQQFLINDAGNIFSFEKLFDFKNQDQDLNTDILYYVNEISREYPQFMVMLNLLVLGQLNGSFNYGALEFDFEILKKIIEQFSVNNNEIMLKAYEKEYKYIYDLFSSTSIEEFKKCVKTLYPDKIFNQNEMNLIAFFGNIVSIQNLLFSSAFKVLYDKPNKDDKEKDLIYQGSLLKAKIEAINSNKKLKPIDFKTFLKIKFLDLCYKEEILFSNKEVTLFNYLNKYESLELNLNELKIKIDNLIKEVEPLDYLKNFQIIKNPIDIYKYVSSQNNLAQNYLNTIDNNYQTWNNNNNLSFNISQKTIDFVLNVVCLVMDGISAFSQTAKIIPIIGWAFAVAESVFNVIFDLISGLTPKTEYYSYIFETNDVKYIWDGGKKTTTNWGMTVLEDVGIESMKLLKPQQIVYPTNSTVYFYNGLQFSNTDELKRKQLQDILNGDYYNKNFHKVYVLDDFSKNNLGLNYTWNTRPQMVCDRLGDINEILNCENSIISETNNDNKSLVIEWYNQIKKELDGTIAKKHIKESFAFAGGNNMSGNTNDGDPPIYGNTANINTVIQRILNTINPILIAQVPILNNNIPIYTDIDNDGEDDSLPKYQLPGISWMFGNEKLNKNNYKYIIYDPNMKKQSDNILNKKEIEAKFKALFFEQFDVESKDVVKYLLNTNNDYDSLTRNINKYKIFSVKTINNNLKLFLNQNDAKAWLMKEMNFTMYSYPIEIQIFEYNNIIFNSKDEFETYVLDNMEVNNG